jgi:hypothetical protein
MSKIMTNFTAADMPGAPKKPVAKKPVAKKPEPKPAEPVVAVEPVVVAEDTAKVEPKRNIAHGAGKASVAE